ncbi:hypothetical protein [Streptosporangium longisporum]|uniref:DUF222 domain-containing protein n=1 Tax=Streptosporangium longisporum TaxID=46187 RepID=A0ABP6L1L2_9ACTN
MNGDEPVKAQGDEAIKALHAVRAAHARIGDAEKAEREAVVAAREIGVQWQKIADTLGMAQANASRKYGPLPTPAGKASDEQAETALARLGKAHQEILDAQLAEIEAVANARRLEITWSAIATEVEMDQPNAVVKYRKFIKQQTQVTVRPDAADLLRGRRTRKGEGAASAGAGGPEGAAGA